MILCATDPAMISAAEKGNVYNINYDGGSLTGAKAGTGMKLYIDADKIRIMKDKIEVLAVPAPTSARIVCAIITLMPSMRVRSIPLIRSSSSRRLNRKLGGRRCALRTRLRRANAYRRPKIFLTGDTRFYRDWHREVHLRDANQAWGNSVKLHGVMEIDSDRVERTVHVKPF